MIVLTLEGNVREIEKECFAGINIAEIIIPGSAKSIGDRAFRDCTNLTKVTLPEGLESIGKECFY